MATGTSGTADISGFFESIQEDAVFILREDSLMPQLVTLYGDSNSWADRKISKYPQVSAQTIGETEDVSTPTVFDKQSLATLTPIEIAAQVILTDRRIETDRQNARTDAAQELGGAMSDKIETDLVTLFSSFTASKGAGAGNAFTLTSVANGISVLRNGKVRGPFSVVLHPYHWLDVWVEIGKPTTSVVASEVANTALKDYFVANLVNAQWYQHSLIPVDGSDDAASAVFNRQALALDTRRAPRLEWERDASKRAYEATITAGYAKGVRRDACGVKLIADATAPS